MTVAAPRRGAAALPPWVAAPAVGAVTLVVALATVSPYVIGAFHDDAIYVILGRALASGAGYRYLNLPGLPGATHYPPGYPALLAVLWRLAPRFPDNVPVFEAANAVLLACAAALAWMLARWRIGLSAWWAAAVAWIGTVTIPPLALADMVLSETLFLAVLLAALLAAERAVARPVDGPPPSVRGAGWPDAGPAALAGVLCGVCALVRSVGLVVIVAAVGACLVRRRMRAAVVLAGAAIAVLMPWEVWTWMHRADLAPSLRGAYGSYAGWLAGAWHRHGLGFAVSTARRNAADIVGLLGVQVAPRLPLVVKRLALGACGALVAAAAPRLARTAPVTTVFVILYAGVVILWPFPPFRFVWAAWLFIGLALVVGAVTVVEWRPAGAAARAVRAVGLAAAALVGLGVARYNMLGYEGHWWNTMQSGLSVKATRPLAWMAAHPTPPGVVISDEDPSMYLYAGRTGVPCNAFTPDDYLYARDTARDRAVLDALLRRFPVGAVVATGPACALAALRLSRAPRPALVAIDTVNAGLAVFTPAAP